MIAKKEDVIIVCDEETRESANFLVQLISLKDDDTDRIIGVEDETVNAAIWDIKKYYDNETTFKSAQKFIFIGKNASANNSNNVLLKYDNYGMSYGWFANRAVLLVQDAQIPKIENFGEVLMKIIEEINSINANTGFELSILKDLQRFHEEINKTFKFDKKILVPVLGHIKLIKDAYRRSELRIEMKKLLYRYLVIRWYYVDINNFMKRQ